jgi:C4-dicarboxylate-specific signal transduction histidine kinase
MSFETVSLLLSWVELGVLLAILFRLGHTFELIANTQRELRRAIHHLGERRAAELANNNAFGKPEIASVSRSRLAAADTQSTMDADDLARRSP